MPGPSFTDLAERLAASVPFVGPEAQERASGTGFRARIGANENVFGASPRAIAAMAAAARESWKYGDPESHELRAALAGHCRVGAENVMVGEGIDGLLGYLVRLLVAPGDRVVSSHGAYPTFDYHVTGFGGELVRAPYREDHEDPEALLELARRHGAKMIYLANPDNPMGSWHGADVLADMIARLPPRCLLVLDEAYVEFAPPGSAPPLDTDNPCVLRLRTFSKAYGMAGARVGYAIGQAGVIDAFNKVRNHFGMCRMSQAGALAALADREYLSTVLKRVADARQRIGDIGRDNGLIPLPSATNFVALDCGRDGDFARAVLAALLARGIFVRMPFVAPQDRCIRVSAGTGEDLDALAAALPAALSEARSGARSGA